MEQRSRKSQTQKYNEFSLLIKLTTRLIFRNVVRRTNRQIVQLCTIEMNVAQAQSYAPVLQHTYVLLLYKYARCTIYRPKRKTKSWQARCTIYRPKRIKTKSWQARCTIYRPKRIVYNKKISNSRKAA